LLHEDSSVKVANEIKIFQIDDKSWYVFILDNDISDLRETVTKHANIKAFVLTKDSLEFKGVLTSLNFGLDSLQPLNDMDI
jgi:non-homologous end joining protein Ku